MRIGVLSDTHLAMADAKLAALLAGPLGGAEALIHAGDHASSDVADYLDYTDPRPYHGVAGNTDPHALRARLGERKVIELGGLVVGVMHGWGPGEGLARRVLDSFPSPPDILIFGHSHIGLVTRIGATLVVNPGSPWQPRCGPVGSVALLEINGGRAEARLIEV